MFFFFFFLIPLFIVFVLSYFFFIFASCSAASLSHFLLFNFLPYLLFISCSVVPLSQYYCSFISSFKYVSWRAHLSLFPFVVLWVSSLFTFYIVLTRPSFPFVVLLFSSLFTHHIVLTRPSSLFFFHSLISFPISHHIVLTIFTLAPFQSSVSRGYFPRNIAIIYPPWQPYYLERLAVSHPFLWSHLLLSFVFISTSFYLYAPFSLYPSR